MKTFVAINTLLSLGQISAVHVPLLMPDEMRAAVGGCEWDYYDTAAWNDDCSGCDGSNQSPIDIDTDAPTYDTSQSWQLRFGPNYKDAIKGEWARKGYTLQFTADNWETHDHTLTYDKWGLGTTFRLWQFHFHWGADDSEGSEHTIDGQAYPLEVHFVHVNDDYKYNLTAALTEPDGLLVIGFLFDIGNSGSQFKYTRRFLPVKYAAKYIVQKEVRDDQCNVKSAKKFRNHKFAIDFTNVAQKHWNYQGGLTTPNCNEVVTWIVSKTNLMVTSRDLSVLRTMHDDFGEPIEKNFRDPQALNGRTINCVGHNIP